MYYIIGAGLAIWLAGIGVGIGIWIVGKKALEVMSKDKSQLGTFLILAILGIALVESAAIYGLIVAFQITWLDPTIATQLWRKVIAAGLSVGLAGLGAGVGEWLLVAGAMDAILRNPETKGKIMTFMVLFLALIEAVAIYGLIIALNLLGTGA